MSVLKGGKALVAGVAVLALASGLSACGGDDDDDAGANGTTTTGADAEASAACATNLELDQALGALFEAEDPEGIKTAYADAGVEELLTKLEDEAPDEISDAVAEGAAALRQVGQTGDPSPLEGFDANELDGYFHENCDYETADVIGKDFSFEGIPDEMAAGDMSVKFTNDGADDHEIVVARKNEGVTETWDELLALPEEQSQSKVTFVAATGASPGDTAYATGKLEPGEHIAVCFIPEGTRGETQGTGQPHAMLGMTQEFTVS